MWVNYIITWLILFNITCAINMKARYLGPVGECCSIGVGVKTPLWGLISYYDFAGI